MPFRILAPALVVIACSSSDNGADGVATHRPASAEHATDTTAINIRRPTLLALFPITQAEVDANADVGEALTDFQQHLESARDSLALRGVAIEEWYTPTVRYRLADGVVSFAPPPESVATYIWIAPDRPAHTHYGVLTDLDLLELTNRFIATREVFKAF